MCVIHGFNCPAEHLSPGQFFTAIINAIFIAIFTSYTTVKVSGD